MVEETLGVFGVSGVVAPPVEEDVLRIVRKVRWSLADADVVSALMIKPPEGDGFAILAIGEFSWVGLRALKQNVMAAIGEYSWVNRRTLKNQHSNFSHWRMTFTFQSLV